MPRPNAQASSFSKPVESDRDTDPEEVMDEEVEYEEIEEEVENNSIVFIRVEKKLAEISKKY